jgi:thiosulfate reductase cytochrome b subunit
MTQEQSAAEPDQSGVMPGDIVQRHSRTVRIWHWLNATSLLILLMSGLMIFNAHPRLYWGHLGANPDSAWLEIGDYKNAGYLRIATTKITITGVIGSYVDANGAVKRHAFPDWATIPSNYSLADARLWHFAFAWVLAAGLLIFMTISLLNGHILRDLRIKRAEWSLRNIWHDIKDHARLRFPVGADALHYHILQKLSYVSVIFIAIPAMIFTGLTMSPGMNAAWPWLLDVFGGRQSARSIHFAVAFLLLAFFGVHIAMVLLAGPYNQVRSMITGKFRIPGQLGTSATPDNFAKTGELTK